MGTSTKFKLKQANKKYKHDRKRRMKAHAEKVRAAQAVEKRGRERNAKRRAQIAYVNSLGAEIE